MPSRDKFDKITRKHTPKTSLLSVEFDLVVTEREVVEHLRKDALQKIRNARVVKYFRDAISEAAGRGRKVTGFYMHTDMWIEISEALCGSTYNRTTGQTGLAAVLWGVNFYVAVKHNPRDKISFRTEDAFNSADYSSSPVIAIPETGGIEQEARLSVIPKDALHALTGIGLPEDAEAAILGPDWRNEVPADRLREWFLDRAPSFAGFATSSNSVAPQDHHGVFLRAPFEEAKIAWWGFTTIKARDEFVRLQPSAKVVQLMTLMDTYPIIPPPETEDDITAFEGL